LRAVASAYLGAGRSRLSAGLNKLAGLFAAPADPKGSPSLAALLSFLWPGLGQLYTRRRRTAAVFAVPALLVTLLLLYALRRGVFVFGAQLFADRTVGLITVWLVLLVGAWRLASVAHAFVGGEQRKERRIIDRAVLGGLAAVIVLSHLVSGGLVLVASNSGQTAWAKKSGLADLATPSHSLKPGQTVGPTATPVATPAIGHRVTILFTGVDSGTGVGRDELLYDSIMVVSYDPTTNSIQMVSVPRDITNFPFYFGGVAPSSMRINALPTDVHDGLKSPDSPYMTLVNEVQYLIGIHIDYYAVMNLDGFVKMIDIVGGIDIVNPTAICDCAYGDPSYPGYWPGYDWRDGSPYGFQLAAGPQHLDGRHALAYVRSRHSAGDNDFARQSRQQQVLLALLHKMAQPNELLNLPTLISTVGASIETTFPRDQVADYVAIAQGVPSGNFKQVVLDGIYFWNYLPSGASCLYYNKVADLSRQLFGQESLWQGKADPAFTCGAA
jgi:LCP family protein required for cell wall assembly